MGEQYLKVFGVLLVLYSMYFTRAGVFGNNEPFITIEDFFYIFDQNANADLITRETFQQGLNEPVFHYLNENQQKRDGIVKKFNEGADEDGKMDINQFKKTFKLLYMLTEILPDGKTAYDKTLLKELFDLNEEKIKEILNGEESITVAEIIVIGDQGKQ